MAFWLVTRCQFLVPDAAQPGAVLRGHDGVDHDVWRRLRDFATGACTQLDSLVQVQPSAQNCYQTASKISVGGAKYTGRRPLQALEPLLHQRASKSGRITRFAFWALKLAQSRYNERQASGETTWLDKRQVYVGLPDWVVSEGQMLSENIHHLKCPFGLLQDISNVTHDSVFCAVPVLPPT